MDDRITVASLLAAQNAQRLDWRVLTPAEKEEFWKVMRQHEEEEAEERSSTDPTPEWGDLEDHGWMGTSTRNNPTIRDDFPASFG